MTDGYEALYKKILEDDQPDSVCSQ